MSDLVINVALIVAGSALGIAALLPTTAWRSCTLHKGGIACEKTLDKANTSWQLLSSVAMGIAVNQRRKNPSE